MSTASCLTSCPVSSCPVLKPDALLLCSVDQLRHVVVSDRRTYSAASEGQTNQGSCLRSGADPGAGALSTPSAEFWRCRGGIQSAGWGSTKEFFGSGSRPNSFPFCLPVSSYPVPLPPLFSFFPFLFHSFPSSVSALPSCPSLMYLLSLALFSPLPSYFSHPTSPSL